jgi:hypothetical protein
MSQSAPCNEYILWYNLCVIAHIGLHEDLHLFPTGYGGRIPLVGCESRIRSYVLLRIRSYQLSLALMLLFLVCSRAAHAQLWSGVLSSSRATDWTQAGVSGGIPSSSWAQCGSTIAPYGSSGSYASPSTILSALSANSGKKCYVLLGNGDFYLNGPIQSSGVNNVELRGGGPQNTHLHFSSGGTCAGGRGSCLVGFQSSDSSYASATVPTVQWTGSYAQGTTTIQLASGSNLVANQTMLVLDQCDDGYSGDPCSGTAVDNGNYFNCQAKYSSSGPVGCSENGSEAQARANRGQQEMALVTACSPACGSSASTTVTLSRPIIHPNWRSSQTPEAWLIQAAQYVGVNGFSIDGANFPYSGLTAAVGLNNLANFWVKNLQLTNFANISIYVAQSTNGNIESNYIYGVGQGNTSNDASGIDYLAFNTVFQNNILQYGKPMIIPTGPGAGDVVAYNVVVNAYTNDSFDFGNIWTGHSNGSDYNLYEGNYANYLTWDQTHGTQLMITAYRNFFTGFESCANGNCGTSTVKQNNNNAIAATSYNRYANIIGNILGTPGVSSMGYTYANASYTFFSGNGLGYPYNLASGNQGVPNAIPMDNSLIATTLRWGNWDAFNGSTQWSSSEVPSGISVYPNSVPTTCSGGSPCAPSFYLNGRPGWWSSSIPFPAIGPDVTAGNVGQCTGKIGTAGQYAGVAATTNSQCTGTNLGSGWAGHVNATPALACYLKLGGAPDGTGHALSGFDATACYGGGSSAPGKTPASPSNLSGTVVQ